MWYHRSEKNQTEEVGAQRNGTSEYLWGDSCEPTPDVFWSWKKQLWFSNKQKNPNRWIEENMDSVDTCMNDKKLQVKEITQQNKNTEMERWLEDMNGSRDLVYEYG